MSQNWPVVSQAIRERLESPETTFKITPISGGDVNQAWHFNIGKLDFFVKSNRRDRITLFKAEQTGLEAIAETGCIRVPKVFACGLESDCAFLLMEYLDLSGHLEASTFAEQLAKMHSVTRSQFGFSDDNYIGSNPQINCSDDNWVEFWREQRLGEQLKLAKQNSLNSNLIDKGEQLCLGLNVFFTDYQPLASLLHGDLWRGNYAADASDTPVIFDPACYYGDHETDLAMMELFGSPGRRFFDIYNEHMAIDSGYSVRRDLYNLYHLLNHANLFGASYVRQSEVVIDKLLAQI